MNNRARLQIQVRLTLKTMCSASTGRLGIPLAGTKERRKQGSNKVTYYRRRMGRIGCLNLNTYGIRERLISWVDPHSR